MRRRRLGLLGIGVATPALVIFAVLALTGGTAAETIPVSGGEIGLDDGFRVVVPDGALSSAAEIDVRRVQPGDDNGPPFVGAMAASGSYSVELEGADLLAPVTISIPYDPSLLPEDTPAQHLLAVSRADPSSRWTIVPSTVDEDRDAVQLEVDHFSVFGVIWLDPALAAEAVAATLYEEVSDWLEASSARAGCENLQPAEWPADVRVLEAFDTGYPGAVLPCPETIHGPGHLDVRLVNTKAYPVEVRHTVPLEPGLVELFRAHVLEADDLYDAAMVKMAELTPWVVYLPPHEQARGELGLLDAGGVGLTYDASDMALFLDITLDLARIYLDRFGVVALLECGWDVLRLGKGGQAESDLGVFDIVGDCLAASFPGLGEIWAASLRGAGSTTESFRAIAERYVDEFSDVDTGTLSFVYVGTSADPNAPGTSTGPAPLPQQWTLVPNDDETFGRDGTYLLWDVTSDETGRYIAVGKETLGDALDDTVEHNAVILTSIDGWTWTRVHDEKVDGDGAQWMEGVAVTGFGDFAVGDAGSWESPPAVWRSGQDGWDQVFSGDTGLIRSIAEGGPGLTAVGFAQNGAGVWTSSDGVGWTLVSHPSFTGRLDMMDVTATASGLVAVGNDRHPLSGGLYDWDAAVWMSPAGGSWTRVDKSGFAGDENTSMFAVASGPDRLVAVGSAWITDGRWEPAVWGTTDGATWERVTDDDLAGHERAGMFDVAAVGSGFVAVGYVETAGDSDAAVWVSADGVDWMRVEDDDFGGPGDQVMRGVAARSDELVAVGYDELRGRVWVASTSAPGLSVSPLLGPEPDRVVSGAGFTPGGRVEARLVYPDGDGDLRPDDILTLASHAADDSGSITWDVSLESGDPAGIYIVLADDTATGRDARVEFLYEPDTPEGLQATVAPAFGGASARRIEASGLTPNGQVEIRVVFEASTVAEWSASVDAAGEFTDVYRVLSTSPAGLYAVVVTDRETGRRTTTGFEYRPSESAGPPLSPDLTPFLEEFTERTIIETDLDADGIDEVVLSVDNVPDLGACGTARLIVLSYRPEWGEWRAVFDQTAPPDWPESGIGVWGGSAQAVDLDDAPGTQVLWTVLGEGCGAVRPPSDPHLISWDGVKTEVWQPPADAGPSYGVEDAWSRYLSAVDVLSNAAADGTVIRIVYPLHRSDDAGCCPSSCDVVWFGSYRDGNLESVAEESMSCDLAYGTRFSDRPDGDGSDPTGAANVVLRSDGLGVVALGDETDAVLEELSGLLGRPTSDSGWTLYNAFGDQPAGPGMWCEERTVTFAGELSLTFGWDESKFEWIDGSGQYRSPDGQSSWRSYVSHGPSYRTAEGLGVGSALEDFPSSARLQDDLYWAYLAYDGMEFHFTDTSYVDGEASIEGSVSWVRAGGFTCAFDF